MPTTSEHIAARDDGDLISRLVAAAEQMDIPNAGSAVSAVLPKLVSSTISVNGEETTLTTVHAYAAAVRRDLLESEAALPPGLNPGAVTDAHLEAAIQAVLGGSIPA